MRWLASFAPLICLTLTPSLFAASTDPATPSAPAETLTESITVTATANPRPIAEVAGTVGVVSRDEIERRLVANARDLLTFEPGVYVAANPTRLGIGGFNIRGVGGNRVSTQIDGVPTAEEFVFGPLSTQRYSLDPEVLRSAEIVRSAASSLYGSDALGGVVSLITRDPADFLADGLYYGGVKLGWDGREDEGSIGTQVALGRERWSGSLSLVGRRGGETDNQGSVDRADALRSAPNPIDRDAVNGLAKVVYEPSLRQVWKLSLEGFRGEAQTEAFSSRTRQDLGPSFGPGVTYLIDTANFDADDRSERRRLSIDGLLQTAALAADTLNLKAWAARDESEQRVDERVRTTRGGGPFGPIRSTEVQRLGLFAVDQEHGGLELQARKAVGASHGLLTYGARLARESFDMLRDRHDFDAASGVPVTPSVLVPTKYFPRSEVDSLGVYLQLETELFGGRLLLVPGLRYDRSDLDADQADAVFLSGNPGTPAPTDASADAISPKLGAVVELGRGWSGFAQYAHGFRTPPYSDVNNGFSNLALGYRTFPNPDLEPETSDNLEAGARGSFGRGSLSLTVFDNRYRDFIEIATLGVDPASGLLEFQARNVASARISGLEVAADRRAGRAWRWRGAFSWIEGENGETDQPLNSIPPAKLVAGLDWDPEELPIAAGLVVSHTAAKQDDEVDRSVVNQFAPPEATVIDTYLRWRVSGALTVELAGLNLTDETSWDWGSVGGLAQSSPVKDRFTSPGRSAAVAVRWSTR